MYYAGIDLGATNLRAQITDPAGTALGDARRHTPSGSGGVIEGALVECLDRACAAAGVDPTELAGVGIGSIGPLDRDAGVVTAPPNVPADRIEVVESVAARVGCPVVLENDGIAAAHGEQRFAGAPANTVYLTLSTGIGAGAIVDGHVLRGCRGNAAEVGHVVVQPGGRQCGCGGTGHWEAYCSGRAIPHLARAIADDGVSTALDLDELAARDVFAAAGEDPVADAVLDRMAAYNTVGIATITHAYAPELISVGGAVACNNAAAIIDPVRARLGEHLAIPAPALRRTPLGEEAVLRGAVALALGNHKG